MNQPVHRPVPGCDTGLGTTYERWALNLLLSRLQAETGIKSLVEGPGDGMTGIAGLNSLGLGLQGVQVTLVLTDPNLAAFAHKVWALHAPSACLEIMSAAEHDTDAIGRLPCPDGSADLVWNFNVMARQSDPQAAVAEMVRVSRKYVLVFVPNRLNYSFWLHRLHHRVARQPWDHGRADLLHPQPWRRMFAEQGLNDVQTLWVDCPWWPDIVDFSQLIGDFCPPLRQFTRQVKPENRMRWDADRLPYYQPAAYPHVHARMARLAFFEDIPDCSRRVWLKRRFAHHVGVLGIKTGALENRRALENKR